MFHSAPSTKQSFCQTVSKISKGGNFLLPSVYRLKRKSKRRVKVVCEVILCYLCVQCTATHKRACRRSPCVSVLFCLCARWPPAWLSVWEPGTVDEIITASFISHHLTSDLPSVQLNATHKTSAVPH